MAHEILSVKMYELDKKLELTHSRIQLADSMDTARLQQQIQQLRQECEENRIVLENRLHYSKTECVVKLARVFDNILRNAIAYCYAGTKIQICAQKKEDDVEIVFSNEGDKIPGTMLQTIFEKFYRVDDSRSSGTGGAGLGLAIAKEIVELHGGHVRAKSNDQKTEFIVTLPSKKEQEEGEEDEVSAPRGHSFRGKSRPAKRTRREKKKGDLE